MTEKCILGMNYIPSTELVVNQHEIKQPQFEVIDFHAHFGSLVLGDNYESLYDTEEIVRVLKSYKIRKIANLDGFWGDELDRVLRKTSPYNKDFIITFGSVDISRLDDNDFNKYVYKTLCESKQKGIRGIKVWKNVSLNMRDRQGRKIPINDTRLRVLWDTAAELDLPVLMHIADPIAFFNPIDEFNERYDELHERPDWSFYGDEYFTFNQLMEMQERLIAENPHTTFVIAHGGSCSENLSFVGRCLQNYPNMYIDIAERISEFGRQPYTSRKFFTEFQDRIVFGTDFNPQNIDYEANFRFLETFDEYFDYSSKPKPPHGNWKIYGIGLDDDILRKVYHLNAEKILKIGSHYL